MLATASVLVALAALGKNGRVQAVITGWTLTVRRQGYFVNLAPFLDFPAYQGVPFVAALLALLFAGVAFARTSQSKHRMVLKIKWGRERIEIPFPSSDTTLSQLRQQLSECTAVPVDQFKLVYGGAVMKDNNAPLSAFNLKPNATIQLIGSAAPVPSARPQAPGKEVRTTQAAMVKTIQAEIDSIHRELLPSLTAFELSLNAPEEPSQESLKQEYTRLGELLLQTLLRLDSFTPEGDWEEARKARKEAVKEIQGLLTRIDTAWKGSQA